MRQHNELGAFKDTTGGNARANRMELPQCTKGIELPVGHRPLKRPGMELPNLVNYDRPTGFPTGMRDNVWERAKDQHGRVRDPVSGVFMSKDKPWDMGHKPGYEFAKHQKSAEIRGISRDQFRKEYYNESHFRPELPSSNRSHKGENKTALYFGD